MNAAHMSLNSAGTTCAVSGDEIVSDSFPIEEVDDVVLKVARSRPSMRACSHVPFTPAGIRIDLSACASLPSHPASVAQVTTSMVVKDALNVNTGTVVSAYPRTPRLVTRDRLMQTICFWCL